MVCEEKFNVLLERNNDQILHTLNANARLVLVFATFLRFQSRITPRTVLYIILIAGKTPNKEKGKKNTTPLIL